MTKHKSIRQLSATLLLLLAAATGYAQAIKNNKTDSKKSSKMTATKMKVEIWSDMVCPFCYLGKHRYEAALKQFADADNVEVVWHSFQLNPDLPKHIQVKENSYRYLAKAKGISYEQSVKMHEGVVAMAKPDGLSYNFDKAIVANSYNAHRLLQMAQSHHLGNEAEERIFKAYFVEGKDIADIATLIQLGKDIGLNESDVSKMLSGNDFSANVDADIKEAGKLGISGVPFFVFDRKYAVSGAQPVDTFLSTLQKSYAEWRGTNGGTK